MNFSESITSIMSTELLTAQVGDPVAKADEIFKNNRIHHIPVLDEEGAIGGVVSKSDFLYLLRGFTENKVDTFVRAAKLRSFKMREIMEDTVETLPNTASIKDAVSLLAQNRFRCLPIVDENKKLVGIVTPNDILKYIDR
jgi:acetoin utilization protein AcuB